MTNNVRIRIFLGLAVLALCFDVHAVVIPGLYTTTVSVADQSDELRKQAIQTGLGDVLVKLTGSRAALAAPGIADVLKQAQNYVVEYGYIDQASDTQFDRPAEGVTADNGSEVTRVGLNVSFDTQAVQSVLRDSFLPIWPADRQVIMLWLVAETSNGYQFIEFADDTGISASVENALERRGAPFKTPLYDLQDRMTLSAEQAWLGSDEQLTEASRRYGIDHWLVIKVPDNGDQSSPGTFRGGWFFGNEEKWLSGDASGESLTQLIDASVADATDQFSKGFTYQAGQPGQSAQLLISGVDNYQDFSAVINLFKRLEVVKSSQVTRVEKSQLYFEAVTEGDLQVLINALDQDTHFSNVVDIGDSIGQAMYRYQWRPGNL